MVDGKQPPGIIAAATVRKQSDPILQTVGRERVVVLGGGVTGLTSALMLARANFNVEVWQSARGMAPPNWVWEYPPYHVEPEEAALRWARVSFSSFSTLARQEPESHVHMTPVIVLSTERLPPNPGKSFLPHFKEGGAALQEARRLVWGKEEPRRKYTDAVHYHAPVCNSVKYLAWLRHRIEVMGGSVLTRTVASIDEAVAAAGGAVVVNCSGLASHELVPDNAVYPCRGQLLHVEAPWVTTAVFDDANGGYVIPFPGSDLELGGTAEDGATERKLNGATAERILRDNVRMIPSLAAAEVGDGYVGLRPCRKGGVRLELEWRSRGGSGQAKAAVVHNYGHGGAGMCLSYGCAEDVVALVRGRFNRTMSSL